jgi:selenocysteine-specific elongation factor
VIIGVAGHIDHGKSALLEALTSRAMDRQPEERRRGITLDLHFAPLSLPGGVVAGVVDVPGHEDLVRTMVAGAAGMDVVLLVIAADEGIMPQTREHLAILEQLAVPAGVVVLTKCDLVEPDWLALVEGEVREWLGQSTVPFRAVCPVSAVTGAGLDGLRQAIAGEASRSRPRPADDLFRLPIDRALSLPGVGTVLTGTAWSGSLADGDPVTLLPAGLAGRVRSLESHGMPLARSLPGTRLAAGIAGLERAAVRRGDVLVRAGDPWPVTSALDAAIHLLADAPHPLVHRARVRVHLGAAEILARVHLPAPMAPGTAGCARLVLESSTVARGGDRFVLRSYSPVSTIGGGRVLDPAPPGHRPEWSEALTSEDPATRLVALVVRRRESVPAALVPLLAGIRPAEVAALVRQAGLRRVGEALLPSTRWEATITGVMESVSAWHRDHRADAGMPLETLRSLLEVTPEVVDAAVEELVSGGRLAVAEGRARLPAFRPSVAGGDEALERIVAAIEAAGLAPPAVAELEASLGVRGAADALRLAARSGRVVAVERDRYYGAAALERFRAALAAAARQGPITPAAMRDRLGISRKYLIPLLEWADAAGLTVRQGEARRPGPKSGAGG